MTTPTTTLLASLTPRTTTTASSSSSCITAIPGPHGYVPIEACNAQWAYSPSFPAAITFSILFSLLLTAHISLAITHRKPFCWVIIMGVAWEVGAFITRSLGSRNQQSSSIATVSDIFFLLAPLWINAFVYMTAGRLIWMLHPEKKIWGLQAIKVGKWFVWLDVFSFLVQGTGGMMLNPSDDAKTQDIGKKIYMSGVGVQQAFIFTFMAFIVRFHLDALKLERQGLLGGKGGKAWKFLTCTLYAVLLLITVRIIYRLAEFSGGIDPDRNKLPFTEGYALGLDAFPMATASLLLTIFHPGIVLKGPESEFPSWRERRMEKKAKKAEKKLQKEARKRGEVFNTGYEAGCLKNDKHTAQLMERDVELGHVGGRPAQVARF